MPEKKRTDASVELEVELDPSVAVPASRQIVDQVWEQVIAGTLDSGQRLPTARELAVQLGVSPSIVERAFEQLERLGVVLARPGQGRFVSLSPPGPAARDRRSEWERRCRELVADTQRLGFSIDDVIDLLSELRLSDREDAERGLE